MGLEDEIVRQNPQWRGEKLSRGSICREKEEEIREELDEDIVTAITGMRRVGKTTLMQRIIDSLEERGERTFYYSFDIDKVEVRELLETFFQEIENESPEQAGSVYIFLDEVQKIEGWSDHVKAYHDRYENLKFFVTGSSSANIRKGGGESLVGRISIYSLTSFTFREFLRYRGISIPEKDFEKLALPENSNRIKAKLPEYLETGGFPELMDKEETVRRERLNDILDLTLYRDIVELFGVGRPELLEAIFKSITETSGNTVNYNKLGKNLDAQYKTVRKYVDALEQSFLIEKSRRLQNNKLQEYKKRPKIYAGEHSFCSLQGTKKGLKAETAAYNHLKTKGETGYWRKKQDEVDIILKQGENLKAFEVKYRNQEGKTEFNSFKKECPEAETFQITKNTLDRDKDKIPLWLLLVHI
ncbi:MAG: ATP-binding protein [Candidatus Nanohaloarchaeota archaeon QJJ-9]|nr:ATP-binding protein [Candidatus Nanohaloarchaeota archaeon QJJ-9]